MANHFLDKTFTVVLTSVAGVDMIQPMAKNLNIMLRIGSVEKGRIENAARALGKSVTKFILDIVMQTVARVEQKQQPRGRGPCPTFFRACCATASEGGTTGYGWAAEVLTQSLGMVCPWEVNSNEEWQGRIDELGELLDDTEEVLAWFDKNLPRCLALVPKRRRDAFVDGVRAYAEENEGLPKVW